MSNRDRLKWLPFIAGTILACFATQVSAQQLGVNGDFLTYPDGAVAVDVTGVLPGSLAERIGILPGDRIISINGVAPRNAAAIGQALTRAGDRTSVVVDRRGQQLTLPPAMSFRPNLPAGSRHPPPRSPLSRPGHGGRRPAAAATKPPDLGVAHQWQEQLGGDSRLILTHVPPGSLGYQCGLRTGDVIVSVNGIPATSRERFNAAYVLVAGKVVFEVVHKNGRRENVTVFGKGHYRHELGLSGAFDPATNVFRVTAVDPSGIGAAAGIKPGTLMIGINGRRLTSRDQLDRIDQRLAERELDEVIFKISMPGGRTQTLRHRLRTGVEPR